jgi:hypothetical protein
MAMFLVAAELEQQLAKKLKKRKNSIEPGVKF